ncbi:ERVV2 protein, partial [Himantopus himantopus]|nr:ERVV2 protein [Himantopus himantopus]
LASQGGVCKIINTNCCVYVDQSGRVTTDLQEIRDQMKILHRVSEDDTSWGFSELWEKLTSWLPNLTWLKQLFVMMIVLVILFVVLCLMVRCALQCCRSSGDSYSEWKKNQLRRRLESNKYFEKV